MNPSDLHHLAAAYSLDALDGDERRAFEAHYPSCEICSREVIEFRETAAVLANETALPPPVALKSAIMAEVAATRQLPPVVADQVTTITGRRDRRREWGRTVVATAAAVVLAVVGTVAVIGLTAGLGGSGTDEVGDLLAAPDAAVASLEGEGGVLRVVWSPSRDQVAVVGDGVAGAGPGRTYALWFLGPDGAAPAGLFRPDSGGIVRTVLTVADADPDAWGVTIEPDGGSPQPTTEVLFSGPA